MLEDSFKPTRVLLFLSVTKHTWQYSLHLLTLFYFTDYTSFIRLTSFKTQVPLFSAAERGLENLSAFLGILGNYLRTYHRFCIFLDLQSISCGGISSEGSKSSVYRKYSSKLQTLQISE